VRLAAAAFIVSRVYNSHSLQFKHHDCICPSSAPPPPLIPISMKSNIANESCYVTIFDGSFLITLSDFLFSAFNFSLDIELPFLKFIKYRFTEKSFRANAVKKL